MSSKYSTKQYISVHSCGKLMSETWCKNIQIFPRYGYFRVWILFCLTLYMVRTKLVLWTVVHPGKIEMLFGVGVTLDQRHTDDGRGQIYLFI